MMKLLKLYKILKLTVKEKSKMHIAARDDNDSIACKQHCESYTQRNLFPVHSLNT